MNVKARVILRKYHHCSILNYLGLDIFHTAIEFDSIEYFYGFYSQCTSVKQESGIFEIEPNTFYQFSSKHISNSEQNNYSLSNSEGSISYVLGYVTRKIFYDLLNKLRKKYKQALYSKLFNNCNHFTKEVINELFPDKYNLDSDYNPIKIFNLTVGSFESYCKDKDSNLKRITNNNKTKNIEIKDYRYTNDTSFLPTPKSIDTYNNNDNFEIKNNSEVKRQDNKINYLKSISYFNSPKVKINASTISSITNYTLSQEKDSCDANSNIKEKESLSTKQNKNVIKLKISVKSNNLLVSNENTSTNSNSKTQISSTSLSTYSVLESHNNKDNSFYNYNNFSFKTLQTDMDNDNDEESKSTIDSEAFLSIFHSNKSNNETSNSIENDKTSNLSIKNSNYRKRLLNLSNSGASKKTHKIILNNKSTSKF